MLKGTVVSVNAEARTVTIKGNDGKPAMLTLSETVRLTRGEKKDAVKLADIKAGEKIKATLKNGAVESLHVRVNDGKKKAGAGKKKKKDVKAPKKAPLPDIDAGSEE